MAVAVVIWNPAVEVCVTKTTSLFPCVVFMKNTTTTQMFIAAFAGEFFVQAGKIQSYNNIILTS